MRQALRMAVAVAGLTLGDRGAPLGAQGAPPGPVSAPASPPPVVTVPQGQTQAQQAAASRLGAPVSNERIADAIRQSGLNEAQIRDRLQAAGMDPSIADPFFRGQAQGQAGSPTPEFAAALQAMGILSADETEEEQAARNPADEAGATSAVFGKSIFTRSASTFDPVTSGPVDPSYRLGVGDNLQLILTGEVELAYSPEIRRDGTVILPQIGQVSLAGLTLDGARAALRQRAGQAYSGIRNGATKLDLAISSIRTNAVFVIGEVEEPGAYQVNALATVFHALARAGGPRERGSFRRVELRRAGRVIKTLDLYDYLLNGDASQDVRLEQGDVIFVPLNSRAVAIAGAVRRPAIFELRDGEGFSELLRFAGGLSPRASVERVQVDRILPAAERAPGKDRVLIDIRLGGNIAAATAFPLIDGDLLQVFEIGNTRRNVVSLTGAVFQPGDYEYRPGMTVDSLVASAQGLLPSAIRDRVLVQRLNVATGRLESNVVNLNADNGGRFVLAEFDKVAVLDIRRQFPDYDVQVTGAVNLPGSLAYIERETLRDVIDRSGGFVEGAQVVSLSRRIIRPEYSDTTSVVYSYEAANDFGPGGRADSIVLEPLDRIDVRFSPGYRSQRFVNVVGAFEYPGRYPITENVDRVLDVVARAGGLLPHAHAESFQLQRNGELVAIDFRRALVNDPEHNVIVSAEDRLTIGNDPRVVRVEGGVQRPAYVLYQRGLSVRDYVELAGGPIERAQIRRAVVNYPSGYSQRSKRVLWLFTKQPEVVSGATIVVPVKPVDQSTNVSDILNRTLQIASTMASIAVAWAVATR